MTSFISIISMHAWNENIKNMALKNNANFHTSLCIFDKYRCAQMWFHFLNAISCARYNTQFIEQIWFDLKRFILGLHIASVSSTNWKLSLTNCWEFIWSAMQTMQQWLETFKGLFAHVDNLYAKFKHISKMFFNVVNIESTNRIIFVSTLNNMGNHKVIDFCLKCQIIIFFQTSFGDTPFTWCLR